MSNYKMAFKKENRLKTLSFILAFLFVIYLLHTPRKGCSCGRQEEMASKFITQDVEENVEVCSAIMRGDLNGIDKNHLSQVLGSMKKKSLLSESYYINATADCQAYIKTRGFLTVHLSKAEKDFPIAYSIVIHEKIEMFERLLRAIYTPQNVYCVHVDKKSPKIFIEAVKAIVACFPNVFVASELESIIYASWSRVQADINCMKDLLKFPVQWRYLLNTCGTDFPIKTNAEIVQSLKHLNGRNSLESEATNSHKRLRWEYHHNVTNMVIRTDVRKTPPPIKSPMFMGNAYFVVTRAFVEHILKSQDIKNFMEWEEDTYSPDEHLWATLHRMPTVPGSNPPNQKYDESDMISISRLVKWSYHEGDIQKGAPYESCSGTHRHAVCIYGTGDLKWILMQKHLFANKFDPLVDDVVIKCLEAFLRHKAIHDRSLTLKR